MSKMLDYGRHLLQNPPDPEFNEREYVKCLAVWFGGSKKIPVKTYREKQFMSEESRTILYISQALAKDSAFPLKSGDKVIITIDPKKKRLIVDPIPGEGVELDLDERE